MNTRNRSFRLVAASLGLAACLGLATMSGSQAVASQTKASQTTTAPAQEQEALLGCLVIVEQGEKLPTSFNRWAKVRNDCGRDIALVTVQLDYHVDPTCTPIHAGGYAVYSWLATLQENVLANYAYECPAP
ncbi:hypothetical protein AB0N79_37320 [Streptomyces microflavus]|uniref:hypothetical protein n=1 Tax=Streptomyces microflavus TaxID=1919 RepID=UPI003449A08E